MDLFVAARSRALRNYAKANGCGVARQHVDDAEGGRRCGHVGGWRAGKAT